MDARPLRDSVGPLPADWQAELLTWSAYILRGVLYALQELALSRKEESIPGSYAYRQKKRKRRRTVVNIIIMTRSMQILEESAT